MARGIPHILSRHPRACFWIYIYIHKCVWLNISRCGYVRLQVHTSMWINYMYNTYLYIYIYWFMYCLFIMYLLFIIYCLFIISLLLLFILGGVATWAIHIILLPFWWRKICPSQKKRRDLPMPYAYYHVYIIYICIYLSIYIYNYV